MNLLTGPAVNKLQQKQLLKKQEELDKRRRRGAKLHSEAGAAVCIQRWFRNNHQKKKQQQQQQEESTICGRVKRWWSDVNTGADSFYHRHVSHDAKPTLAELAKRKPPPPATSSTDQKKNSEEIKTNKNKDQTNSIQQEEAKTVEEPKIDENETVEIGNQNVDESAAK